MITATLDTMRSHQRPLHRPTAHWQRWLITGDAGVLRLARSQEIFSELEDALRKPYFAQRLTHPDRRAYLALVRSRARFVDLTTAVSAVATHPEDDLILTTAVSAGADYLVTGDRKLQTLGTYQGVRIVSPRQFVEILGSRPADPL